MSVQRENAVINNTIILKNYFRFAQTGDYFDPSAIAKVEILDSDGTTVIETLTGASIVKNAVGQYQVVASAVASAKTIYDKWYFTPSTGATAITKTNTCVVWETAAGAGGLTTLSAVKEFLQIATAVTDDDTFITNLISRISADIEKECGRTFLAANYTEYHDGDSTSILMLDQYPVNSITSIHDDVDREYNADDLIDSDDYAFYSESGIVELDGLTFATGIKNIKVIYNAGYTTIPTDLEQACIKRVAIEYLTGKAGVNAFDSDNVTRLEKMKESADATIEKYKKIR